MNSSKKYDIKRFTIIFAVIFFAFNILNFSFVKYRAADTAPITDSSSVCVEDIKTKSIVFRKNAGEKIKLKRLVAIIGAMTLYENGQLGDDSKKVEDLIENQNLSHMDYFAKKIYKSNDAFIKAMNDAVRKLGCKDTEISTINGDSDKDKSTIADLNIILGRAIDLGYKNKLNFSKTIQELLSDKGKSKKAEKKKSGQEKSESKEIFGVKLFSSKEKDRIYSAVVGKKNENIFVSLNYGAADDKSSVDDGVNSLSYTMNIYRTYKVVSKGEKVGKIKVKGGRSSYCKVVAKEDLFVTLPQEGEDSLVKTKLEAVKEMKAPIKKDQKVGSLQAMEAGEVTAKVDVITGEEVVKGGPWSKIGISDYMMAIGGSIIVLLFVVFVLIKRRKCKKRKRIEEIRRRRREEEARRIAIEREEKRRRNWPY